MGAYLGEVVVGAQDLTKIIFQLSSNTHLISSSDVCTHKKQLTESILMSTHNLYLYEKYKKNTISDHKTHVLSLSELCHESTCFLQMQETKAQIRN